jgi:hypothetical protein
MPDRTLVKKVMIQQANGGMRIDWRPAGIIWEIAFPI